MPRKILIGVSLKMYFGFRETLRWTAAVSDLARSHPAVVDGSVELFVMPGFVSLVPAIAVLEGSRVLVGAQNLATADGGAFTGEVSAIELAEAGVALVEVGHAERRRLFGEDDGVIAQKAASALRNGLVPVLCVGEQVRSSPAGAVEYCLRQLESALAGAPTGRVIVAYEPVWAIGADKPAAPAHIRIVCAALRTVLNGLPGRNDGTVIYGGSAGPGLLADLGVDVDGLFLGRFAHDTASLAAVLDDAAATSYLGAQPGHGSVSVPRQGQPNI